jgi:CubicO group peptidase (beta-lactamase class C family)
MLQFGIHYSRGTGDMTNQQEQATTDQAALFSGVPQYENFARIQHVNPVTSMTPAEQPFEFPEGAKQSLPTTYQFEGDVRNVHALLGATHTSALLVLKQGSVCFEEYWLTGGRDVQWISMSVAKSFVSALVGIALAEGSIRSIEDAIDQYVPGLKDSAYRGVRIKDVLQMSSGVRWNEDFSDHNSEIYRLSEAAVPGGSVDQFMASLQRASEPGTRCVYSSADTQALGMLVAEATGRSLTEYMQEKLYSPLGMESPGHWITDSLGRELAYVGLLMTARDFAKFGELYRKGGLWQDQQIVPREYVDESIRVDGDHVQPGGPIVGDHVFGPGYGYQWWLPAGGGGDYSAIGVYNQYIYVDPKRDTVIVKLSANPAYGTTTRESDNKDLENIAVLQAISQHSEL